MNQPTNQPTSQSASQPTNHHHHHNNNSNPALRPLIELIQPTSGQPVRLDGLDSSLTHRNTGTHDQQQSQRHGNSVDDNEDDDDDDDDNRMTNWNGPTRRWTTK